MYHSHGRIILTPDHYMVVIRDGEELHIQAQEVKRGDRVFLIDHGKDRLTSEILQITFETVKSAEMY